MSPVAVRTVPNILLPLTWIPTSAQEDGTEMKIAKVDQSDFFSHLQLL